MFPRHRVHDFGPFLPQPDVDPLGPLPKAKTVGGCEQCGVLRGRKSYVYRLDGMWRCYECARKRMQSS